MGTVCTESDPSAAGLQCCSCILFLLGLAEIRYQRERGGISNEARNKISVQILFSELVLVVLVSSQSQYRTQTKIIVGRN